MNFAKGANIRPDLESGSGRRHRVLLLHNRYQHRGGEDSVVDSERELLEQHGHPVELLTWHNDDVAALGAGRVALRTVWSFEAARQVNSAIERFRPDVVHAHNTFPLASPSVFWAAHRAGIATVNTLHNFRLLCPQAMLLREGRVCEQCVGRIPLAAVQHGCYRGSRAGSAAVATMLVTHRALGSYRDKITRYIALNAFCRAKFIEGGLPSDRIVLKPNFVAADQPPPEAGRDGLLFVGRLSAEKGLATLAEAARRVPAARIRVVGSGPDEALLHGLPNVERLGQQNAAQVMQWMARSVALLLPSLWYENFPRTLVESYAQGLPVIASRIGALGELVESGQTGLLFGVGNAAELADRMTEALADPPAMRRMGRTARARYEAEYTPEANYRILSRIYDEAIAARRGESR